MLTRLFSVVYGRLSGEWTFESGLLPRKDADRLQCWKCFLLTLHAQARLERPHFNGQRFRCGWWWNLEVYWQSPPHGAGDASGEFPIFPVPPPR